MSTLVLRNDVTVYDSLVGGDRPNIPDVGAPIEVDIRGEATLEDAVGETCNVATDPSSPRSSTARPGSMTTATP